MGDSAVSAPTPAAETAPAAEPAPAATPEPVPAPEAAAAADPDPAPTPEPASAPKPSTPSNDDGNDDDGTTAEHDASHFSPEKHHDAEEVKARLFATPDLGAVQSEVSSVWSWVSSKAQDMASEVAPLAAGKLESLREQAGPLAEKVARNVKEAAEVADAKAKELVEQVREVGVAAGAAAAAERAGVLPWEERASAQFSDAIRDRILELSSDDKTFLVPPPDAVGFSFDFEARAADARKVMAADPKLQEKRFSLVPKEIEEASFWRNYFYRVSLIKEAYQSGQERDAGEQEAGPRGDSVDDADAASPVRGDDELGGEWGQGNASKDDGLDLNDDGDSGNFDMLDDDELLASAGLHDDGDDGDDDDEDDKDLEARIAAELDLGDD